MTPEHVLRILRRINDHPAGLTATYDAHTDRALIEWRGMPSAPATRLLRASEADDAQLAECLARFLAA
ncbi:hypothetical protein A9Z40_03235 [Microbacterium arborescens]|uniref:Uncharacterized protein n=1 Tax=Microbacterium arborescens TaxID=33883 RepID=A0ABX2WIV6_9MICO|nr:hypothetical protein [Microbacterium arborescens]OAZ40969.1 hypothetical protein A9Z40_03235 [Microbacterium arborescens]